MKKTKILSAVICLAMILTACKGKETMSLDMNYRDTYTIDSEKISQYENLSWTSDDDSIASINLQGEIVANGPGTALLTAKNDDKIVAEYTVNVTIIPVTGIVLSTNSTEIVVDDGFQLNYALFPDKASDYGISWKSADENVAVVNQDGYVLAKKVGCMC